MKFNKENNLRVVYIDDLSFISNRNHEFGWLGLHLRHFRIKYALSRADKVVVPSAKVAMDVAMYYFFPKDRIVVMPT